MDSKKLQNIVNKTFVDVFGYTPLNERINDIFREALELQRYRDIQNLKEEAGDLLSSLIQLCNESGWNFEELIRYTCEDKIPRRQNQYKSLGRKYNIALLGGAFNPISIGHIQVATFVLNTSKIFDEVWIIPAFKHLYNKPLVDFEKRLEMCKIAAKADGRIKVFDYEKIKNLAGETYHLMKTLTGDPNYENYNFSFIIGQDNANTFDKWYNYSDLERLTRFIIIPRVGYEPNPNAWYLKSPHIYLNNEQKNPIIEVSSTDIRNGLKRYYIAQDYVKSSVGNIQLEYNNKLNIIKEELLKMVDGNVLEYILSNNLYND